MIDTHCHLDMSPLCEDLEGVISRARDSGVENIITVGADLSASLEAVRIAKDYRPVYASVGVHPHDAKDVVVETITALRDLLNDRVQNKIVALGEIGLDYHYDLSPRGVQRGAFERLLELAKEFDLPVIVHNREADEDTRAIIGNSGIKKALFHCFSSHRAMAEWVINKGYSISFAGNITFKKAQAIRDLAIIVPDDRLMLETDAPYLAPEPLRGKRNEPAFIQHTARLIADLRGISTEDFDRITTLNARRFFGIGEPPPSVIAYKIRDNLYLNLTSACSNACSFCIKFDTDFVKGHNLRISEEPTARELIDAIGDPKAYKEVVFCGLGEPTERFEVLKETARWVKSHGGRVRLNTNGLGRLINGRDIIPELKGLVDSISVSLNAHNSEVYRRLCRPSFSNAYGEVLSFIRDAKEVIGDVAVTVVDIEGVDIEACRDIAQRLGARFRIRRLDSVG